ncbi:MAG: hypothetical protein KAV87_28835 [Desulfobacteraceae bacterium]|nr:hypothetical protein [Desulfobacteraceae bacterium]
MEWELVMVVAIPILISLFPAAFVWYLNIGAIFQVEQEARRKRKAAREKEARASAIAS